MENPVYHSCTKHIEIGFHFVQEKVASSHLQVQFISNKDQIAYSFTKPIVSKRFTTLLAKLNVRFLPLNLRPRVEDQVYAMQDSTSKATPKSIQTLTHK